MNIETTRDVCDVGNIAKDVKLNRAVMVGLQRAETFVKAIWKVTNTFDKDGSNELKNIFKKFIQKLEKQIKE